MRLLGWQTFTLLIPILVLAFVTRSQPNWAAPAYVAGSIFAARYLLTRQLGRGAAAGRPSPAASRPSALYAATVAYAVAPVSLPRTADPFKKMRIADEFCGLTMSVMAEEGAEAILSNDRRRLSECMFLGQLLWQDIAVWNPDPWPENHHELVATLNPGDERPMILVTMARETAERYASHFEEAREIETGTIQTHADARFGYSLWFVQGFRDY